MPDLGLNCLLRFSEWGLLITRLNSGGAVKCKDLRHFDRISAYFSDASQNFCMLKISKVFS